MFVNVTNRKKTIRKTCIVMLFLTIVAVVMINIFGVCLGRKPQGGSFLQDDGETVEYSYFGWIVNYTPFTREVVLNASSKRDAEVGLIIDPKLEIVEIRAYSSDNTYFQDGEIVYEGNKLAILPFTEIRLNIVCKGQYGGEGNGARHPPEITISWPETLHIR